MNPLDLFMTWLAGLPLRVRVIIYNAVLLIAVILALLVWVLPLLDIDHLGRLDLRELGLVAIATSALAALLAKANARPASSDAE